MKRLSKLIISITLTIALLSQATIAHAFWSPVITERVQSITQNIQKARMLNGDGDLTSVVDQITNQVKYEKANNQATAVVGTAAAIMGILITHLIIDSVYPDVLDDIFMIFNVIPSSGFSIASNCLRNDIWSLQLLNNAVKEEMLKSFFMLNSEYGWPLYNDYLWIRNHISALKRYPKKQGYDEMPEDLLNVINLIDLKDIDIKNRKMVNYFFPENTVNYYGTGEKQCPLSDIGRVVDNITTAANNLIEVGSADSAEWGNIWEMAKARAKKRAADWIQANKITLTIGGTAGKANSKSLFPFSSFKIYDWNNQATEFAKNKQNMEIGWDQASDHWKGTFANGIIWDEKDTAYATGFAESFEGFNTCRVVITTTYGDDKESVEVRECTEEDKVKSKKAKSTEIVVSPDGGAIKTEYFRSTTWGGSYRDILEQSEGLDRLVEAKILELRQREDMYDFQNAFTGPTDDVILQLDKDLTFIEGQIERAYEGAGYEAGMTLPTLCKGLKHIQDNHCANKAPSNPSSCQ